MTKVNATITVIAVASLLPSRVLADQLPTKEGLAATAKQQYSPYVGRNYPTRVLWGDTHLHTAVSVDAGTMCRLGQEDAYRFARGEEIATTYGLRARLSRPLDYVVITAGGFDLLCEVVCESDAQLLELLSNRIRAVPGVRSTQTFMYLKLAKQTYSWGAR